MPGDFRCFVAVPVPADVAAAIEDALRGLRAEISGPRWIAPEMLHLTILFLGSIDEEAAPAIGRVLARETAAERPMEIELGAPGWFDAGRAGRVAWIGLRSGGLELDSFAHDLTTVLAREQLLPEGSAPRGTPHLTIARRASAELSGRLGDALEPARPLRWTARQAVLYRSRAGAWGHRYEPIAEGTFAG
ncbi:MAG: RNA 2',3'-cyclic phosphodiesterase [Candidatus Limnocylindrales bacterium]